MLLPAVKSMPVPAVTRSTGLLAVLLVLGGLWIAGCSPRAEYAAGEMALRRSGWDTLYVNPTFVKRTTPGRARPVQPDTALVRVFDAAYDTLYAGPGATISIPDRALGSREPLIVEACGIFGTHTICEQEGLRASPKRVGVGQSRISYPEDADFQRGSYDVRFVVERKAYHGDQWKRIDRTSVPGSYLLAYVQGRQTEDGRRAGVVRVPLEDEQGRFNLARYDGYDDFRYYLQSTMHGEATTATVSFEVYAGLSDGSSGPVAQAVKHVRQKTRADRQNEARRFARQAARQVVRRLGGFRDEDRVRVTVDDWSFDRSDERYTVEVRMRWSSGAFFESGYVLEGTLNVGEGGQSPSFQGRRGNRRAVRRWHRTVDGRNMSLRPLNLSPQGQNEPPPAT